MKKRAQSLASNHHTLRVAPPDVDREPLPTTEPTQAPFLLAIEALLKKQLLAPGSTERGMEVTVTGLRPIRLAVRRFGHTALVAGVVRGDENVLEGLTVCRAGLDNDEDETALIAAAELIIASDDRPEFRQLIEHLVDKVRQQPTPLAVHIHFDEDNFDDPSARIITHCLAACFFDQFGMEKLYETTDI